MKVVLGNFPYNTIREGLNGFYVVTRDNLLSKQFSDWWNQIPHHSCDITLMLDDIVSMNNE